MSLLTIGRSGLYAAQAALSTTGHNITNANVAGYSRQTTVQETSIAMGSAIGYIGTGTQIADVKRYSDEFLNAQVRTAQASTSGLDAYQAQISQIDNLLSDSTSGLSPALQDYFAAVQNLTGDRAGVPSRGALLSSAETLAGRFQSMDARMQEIRKGVNTQVTAGVTLINTYASQIADLNDKIGKLSAGESKNMPNDLLDQRDQLVMELNKQVKATVMPGDNNSLTVSIGSGQPLVVGASHYALEAIGSPTDPTRITVGYATSNKVTPLPESALTGGALGAVLEFRSKSLDLAQNSLGRVAIGLASSVNAQQNLGLDANGQPGADFFSYGTLEAKKNVNNSLAGTTVIQPTITDPTQLTTSDYKITNDGTNYHVIRLSDNKQELAAYDPAATTELDFDGVHYAFSGTTATGDNFLVQPTLNGAANFKVKLTEGAQIAAAAPIATSVPLIPVANKGTGKISEGTVDKTFLAAPPASWPVTVAFADDGTTKSLSGFPGAVDVTVNGTTTSYAADPVPYTDGATYRSAGMSITLTGRPVDGDKFLINKNPGIGDTRNASLIGDLQSANILDNKSATFQSAYAHMVSNVGNKTREVQVNGEAAAAQLQQAQGAADNVSGVNLDEEAANLLKYQQAYQAAGKVMQVADTIFNALLQIGH
jgi:flagellar hook-associated protein 1 FlgK